MSGFVLHQVECCFTSSGASDFKIFFTKKWFQIHSIEEAFSKIKHWLRLYQDYYLATEGNGILYNMWEILNIITPSNAARYFFHAGYF